MRRLSQPELEKIALDIYYKYFSVEEIARRYEMKTQELEKQLCQLSQINPRAAKYIKVKQQRKTPQEIDEIKKIAKRFARNDEGDER